MANSERILVSRFSIAVYERETFFGHHFVNIMFNLLTVSEKRFSFSLKDRDVWGGEVIFG